jgi:hypothetical protein
MPPMSRITAHHKKMQIKIQPERKQIYCGIQQGIIP